MTADTPASMIAIAKAQAKIGLSMKKLEITAEAVLLPQTQLQLLCQSLDVVRVMSLHRLAERVQRAANILLMLPHQRPPLLFELALQCTFHRLTRYVAADTARRS